VAGFAATAVTLALAGAVFALVVSLATVGALVGGRGVPTRGLPPTG
jgi:hypothetical protein